MTWVVLLIHRRALLTRISVEFEEDEQGKRRTHTWELDEPRMQHSGRWLQLKATLLCGRVVIIEGLNLAAPLAGQWAADGGEVDLADLFLGIDVNAPLTAPAGGLPAEVGRVAPL